jgi:dienelactone hydrolase
MRPLEWLLAAFSILAIVWFLPSRSPSSTLWFGAAAAVLVLLHAGLEGIHWQMAPAYLALFLTLLVGAAGLASPMLRLVCGTAAAAMVAASLLLSYVLPMFKLPVPTGRYPVGTRTLFLTDLNRTEMHEGAAPGKRQVVAQLWYPAATARWRKAVYRRRKETSPRSSYQAVLKTHSLQDAPVAAGSFPVLVHNSAWGGFRNRGTFITQDLASHGFIVVALSHPYNSSRVELADGSVAHADPFDLGFSRARFIPLQDRFAMADQELAIQTADCRFVLDQLEILDRTPGHPLESRMLMDRVGAYGYSFGAAVCVDLAREDSRVRAALELDGVLHGSAAAYGLDKPVMLIDSPWILSLGGDPANPRLDQTSQFWTLIDNSKVRMLELCGGIRVVIDGLVHADFTDQTFMSPLRRLSWRGSVPPKRVAHILNTYILAFFQQTLLDKPSTLFSQDAKDFPEVTFEEWLPCVKEADG